MTREQLLHLFRYDRENGLLIWDNHWQPSTLTRVKGKIAGNMRTDECGIQYYNVMINSKSYLLHRIIFFLETNTWPEQVDHIDGNGLNNKYSNLRASDQRSNQRNRNVHRKGQPPGCHFCKTTGKWRAQIKIGKEKIHIGRFETQTEASAAASLELFRRGL